jgi:hypothetical protein
MSKSGAGADEPALKWYRPDEYDEPGYAAHLAGLVAELPVSLRLLSEAGGSINLHDARFIDARS